MEPMPEAMQVTLEEMVRWVENPVLMLGGPQRDLLRRSAWAHTFDRDLYDNVLVQGSEEPAVPFADLVKHRFVEGLPGRRYRVRNQYRANLLDTWREEAGEAPPLGALPPGPLELSRQLAEYYADRENDLERLRHLAVSDPEEAAALFEALFGKADRRFDLPRCHPIVQVLEERGATLATLSARLAPPLRELAVDKRRRLEARWLWAQDYYWTVTYVGREKTRYLLIRLWSGKRGWLRI